MSRFAGPTLALLRCPLPSSVHRHCHVLDEKEHTGPRHSHAKVRSHERPVPGWLPCLYRRPLGGRGWKQGCHCCPRCARLVSLGPRLIPPGPLGGSPHQNFGAELLRPRASGCGVSRPRPPPKPLGPGLSPELRLSLPCRLGQEGGWPERQSSWLQKMFNALR